MMIPVLKGDKTKRSRKKLFILSFILIAVCVFLAYSNSLTNPFIWDDAALVVGNPLIKEGASLKKIFTSDLYYGTTTGSNFYRPLQTLSYRFDYFFCQLEPKGYHLTNIFLQSLVSCLAFLWAYLLLGNLLVALAASLLFAVCPLHTEAVTYISGRAEMLMGIFLLSSFILFIKSENASKGKFILTLFSLSSFILALLSKELATVFPFAIFSYSFYYAKENHKRFVYFLKIVLPFFVISGVYVFLRLWLLRFMTLRPAALTRIPFLIRITVFPKVLLTYLKLLVFPVDLHMSRELIRPTSFIGTFFAWFALGSIVVCIYYCLRNKKGYRKAPFLLSWFLIFLLPQSGLWPINAFVAEHFLYLSSLSFFIAVVASLYRFLRKPLFILTVASLLFFYGILTFSRNYEWSDPVVFFQRIIKFSPSSFQAHNNLGLHYQRLFLYGPAMLEYKKALEIMPDLLEARSNLADLYFKMGRLEDSLKEYAVVEKSAPGSKAGEVQNNIAAVYEMQKAWDRALEKYRLALRLDPDLDFTHFNLARIYFAKGQVSEAAQEVLKSLSGLDPSAEEGPLFLEWIEGYLGSGKHHACAMTFYNDLGVLFAKEGFFDAAIVAFRKALELEPRYSDAHFNLGLSYWKKGLKARAAQEFKATLKINPGHFQAKAMIAKIRKEKALCRIFY
ncbi:MAG: tetratricopeptide repeat protein [Candidatus Omnitrophota bacterium]